MRIIVLLFLFITLGLIGCGIPYRMSVRSIIQDVEKFRDAQQIYKEKYGNGSYASIRELIDKGLVEERFADLEEHGYKFNLTVEYNRYNLLVVPEAEENKSHSEKEDELSLFVDQTGIIRASVTAKTPASANSSPISPK